LKVHLSAFEGLQGPAPHGYNGETISGGWMELVCQLLPSPISTRLYDTYPETVKVSHDGKDNGDGQTQGGRNQQKSPLPPSCSQTEEPSFGAIEVEATGVRAKSNGEKKDWRRCPNQ